MAQHDYFLSDQPGAGFRQDINNALAAIVSNNSGPNEPNPTYAYQRWADTTTGLLKQRNAANNGWIPLMRLDGAFLLVPPEDGSITTAKLADGAVTTPKIAEGSITSPKIAEIDASKTNFTQAGTGSITRTVDSKLKDIVSRGDFDSDTNFNAAKGAKPNIDGANNLNAKVTPEGENTQINLSEALRPTAGINRGRINYYTPTSVEVAMPQHITMGGFRFMGNYKKGRAPVFSSGVNGTAIISTAANLGAETSRQNNNWYAVFACANNGNASASYRLMPFVRVGSVAGSVCTLNYAGENSHTITPVSYSWDANVLAGTDCLVINEGSGNRFSGRVTQITANTGTTVTLNTIGSVGAYDFLLPAPPGFTHYCYLGAFYNDSGGETYNIADGGVFVQSYMAAVQDPNWTATGAVAGPPGNQIRWGGYISPLATGVYLRIETSTSTTAGGNIYTNFSHDSSNHVVATDSYYKEAASSSKTMTNQHFVNFSVSQSMWWWTSGGLQAFRVVSQLRAFGWIEP